MFRKFLAVGMFATLLAGTVLAQDAKTVIGNASKAMGADTLKTLVYGATGTEFSFGQAVNPSSAWPGWAELTYTRTIDYDAPGWRIDRVLEEVSPQRRGGGLPPGANQVVMINPNTPWANQVDLWLTPHGFLKAAVTNNATVQQQTTGGKRYNVVTFMGQNKAKVNGYLNDKNEVEKVETWIDNPMTGDTLMEVNYTGYRDFGGVKFPTKILQKQGGYPTLDMTVTAVKANGPVVLQQQQGGRGNAQPAAAPQPPASGSQKLAEGVYLILPAYAALAVDFKDYIVIIEGPQSEVRATAIIDEARKVIPNKPIRYVVNTHSHFDHSSGLRTFVAEGATILTHQVNKPYFEKLFAMPRTLNPDKLAQNKAKLNIETVGDKKVLTDGNQVIELHRLQNSTHVDGMLVAYLPKQKILVEADAFNPPAQANAPPANPPNPYHVNLLQNIDRLKLDVETIIPVHYPADGRKVTKAELMRAVGRSGN